MAFPPYIEAAIVHRQQSCSVVAREANIDSNDMLSLREAHSFVEQSVTCTSEQKNIERVKEAADKGREDR